MALAGWFAGNGGWRTHPGGELRANPFGLFDIHGNVWEWMQDGWNGVYYDQFREQPAMNPVSPFVGGSLRVFRGRLGARFRQMSVVRTRRRRPEGSG